MTVRELIEELTKLPQDLEVIVGALCDDYDTVKKISVTNMTLWDGPPMARHIGRERMVVELR